MIKPNQNSTKVLKPGIRPLNILLTTKESKFTPILNLDLIIRTLTRYQIYLSLALQTFTKWLAPCRPIVNQSRKAFPWSPSSSQTRNPDGVELLLDQRRFMGRYASKLNPKRCPLTIRHHHKLCSFSTFCFTDAFPPFFADENVPSAKTSSYGKPTLGTQGCKQMLPDIPKWIGFFGFGFSFPASHSRRRYQQVFLEGKRSGISFHRAADRKNQRILSRQARFSARFWPPRVEVWTFFRCLSAVSSYPNLHGRFRIKDPFNEIFYRHKPYIQAIKNARQRESYETASNKS